MTMENIKRFFKPDRKKVLLFIILSVLLPTISFLTDNHLILTVCRPFHFNYIESQPVGESTDLVSGVVSLEETVIVFVPFIFAIIYFYFLSCLIIFLYRRIKSKK